MYFTWAFLVTRYLYWYQSICLCDLDHIWNRPLSGAFVFYKHILLNFVNVFYLFHNYLPLEKGVVLHLNILESPLPKDILCQVWLKLVLYSRWCVAFFDSRWCVASFSFVTTLVFKSIFIPLLTKKINSFSAQTFPPVGSLCYLLCVPEEPTRENVYAENGFVIVFIYIIFYIKFQ